MEKFEDLFDDINTELDVENEESDIGVALSDLRVPNKFFRYEE